jgi:hypothetical protein
MYNNNYFCLIKIPNSVKIKLITRQTIKLYNGWADFFGLNPFLKQFSTCESTKIKFTGKGYKIKKNSKNSLVLLFNRSHTTTIWWKNIFLKKLKKYKMYIKYTKMNTKIIETITNIRPINIFTKKGLRKSRQVLLKKKGKK